MNAIHHMPTQGLELLPLSRDLSPGQNQHQILRPTTLFLDFGAGFSSSS